MLFDWILRPLYIFPTEHAHTCTSPNNTMLARTRRKLSQAILSIGNVGRGWVRLISFLTTALMQRGWWRERWGAGGGLGAETARKELTEVKRLLNEWSRPSTSQSTTAPPLTPTAPSPAINNVSSRPSTPDARPALSIPVYSPPPPIFFRPPIPAAPTQHPPYSACSASS